MIGERSFFTTSQAPIHQVLGFLGVGVKRLAWLDEAINRFREELSMGDQLRHRLGFRAGKDSPVLNHYSNALDALGHVSVALGTAAALPADSVDAGLKQTPR